MISGYSAFANYGQRAQPMMVTRICDSNGHVIAEIQPQHNQAISMESAYRMIDMMRGVITHGTATSRIAPFNINADQCGKTGTTNFNADAWWIGFTPELITGVWFGGEDRYIHFQSTGEGQGAAAALPIYGLFMRAVFDDASLPYSEDVKFHIPEDFKMCGEHVYDNEEYLWRRSTPRHETPEASSAEANQAQDQEILNSMMD